MPDGLFYRFHRKQLLVYWQEFRPTVVVTIRVECEWHLLHDFSRMQKHHEHQ